MNANASNFRIVNSLEYAGVEGVFTEGQALSDGLPRRGELNPIYADVEAVWLIAFHASKIILREASKLRVNLIV